MLPACLQKMPLTVRIYTLRFIFVYRRKGCWRKCHWSLRWFSGCHPCKELSCCIERNTVGRERKIGSLLPLGAHMYAYMQSWCYVSCMECRSEHSPHKAKNCTKIISASYILVTHIRNNQLVIHFSSTYLTQQSGILQEVAAPS